MRLTGRFSYQVKPVRPYSFFLTIRKPSGWSIFTPFETYHDSALWTALHFDNQLMGVKLRSLGTVNRPLVDVVVFTRKRLDGTLRETVKKSLEDLLAFTDDLGPFYNFAGTDPILKHAVKDRRGMHDTSSNSLFARATLAILLQMTGIKRSNEMMNCMITRYGDIAEFDRHRIRVWPTPQQISKLEASQLAKSCKVGYRAKLLVKLAKVMTENKGPTMSDLKGLSREEARTKLMELPGIGDYSSDIVNRQGGFPIDAWSAEVFGKLFYGKEPENNREAVAKVKDEGLRRWGKWAWMAFFYVVQDLENLSKHLKIPLRLE